MELNGDSHHLHSPGQFHRSQSLPHHYPPIVDDYTLSHIKTFLWTSTNYVYLQITKSCIFVRWPFHNNRLPKKGPLPPRVKWILYLYEYTVCKVPYSLKFSSMNFFAVEPNSLIQR